MYDIVAQLPSELKTVEKIKFKIKIETTPVFVMSFRWKWRTTYEEYVFSKSSFVCKKLIRISGFRKYKNYWVIDTDI